MASAPGLIFLTVLLMMLIIVLLFVLLRYTEAPYILQKVFSRLNQFDHTDLNEESAILTTKSLQKIKIQTCETNTCNEYDSPCDKSAKTHETKDKGYYQQVDEQETCKEKRVEFEPLPATLPPRDNGSNSLTLIPEPAQNPSILSLTNGNSPSQSPSINLSHLSSRRRSSLDSVDNFLENLDEQTILSMKRATSSDSIESSASAFELSETEQDNGQLQVRAQYDNSSQMLHIWILQAFDLRISSNDLVDSEFWVVLFLLPHQKPLWRSQLHTGANNPQFHEEFKQCVRSKDISKIALLCQVYSRPVATVAAMSPNVSVVGQAKVRLKDFNLSSPTNLHLALLPVNAEIDEAVVGEILISLNYQPSSERLSLVLSRIRNLNSENIQNISKWLVRAYLVQGTKVNKKKTTPQPIQDGCIEFNESMIFNLQQSKLDKVYLRLSICSVGSSREAEYSTVGHVTIGSRRWGKQLGHWQQMLENPRKPIAMWQDILLKKII